ARAAGPGHPRGARGGDRGGRLQPARLCPARRRTRLLLQALRRLRPRRPALPARGRRHDQADRAGRAQHLVLPQMPEVTEPRGTRLFRLAFWAAALLAFVMAVLPQPQLPTAPSDKLLHVLAFATLSLLGCLAFPRVSLLKLAVALSAFGALIEVVQAIPGLN